jgi:ElaA protein
MMNNTTHIRLFAKLKANEIYEILRLRSEIFVVEQNCIYNDLDGLDLDADHLFIKTRGKIAAYARILKPGTRFPVYSIGRVVVKKEERGKSLGKQIVQKAIQLILQKDKNTEIKISAQQYLRKFYEDLGFEVITEMYLEDGIPHYGMLYQNRV